MAFCYEPLDLCIVPFVIGSVPNFCGKNFLVQTSGRGSKVQWSVVFADYVILLALLKRDLQLKLEQFEATCQ